MATVKFGTFDKRRNSTKIPTVELSDTRTVTLKERTSQDRPTFVVTGNNFNYNYCQWDNKYYFIDEIESLRNNEAAIHCVMDPLATYKQYILASTQFVCYSSSVAENAYLADTRIPVLKNARSAASSAAISNLFNSGGFYVLTAVGKDGCVSYGVDKYTLDALLDKINDWSDDLEDDIFTNHNYDFSTVENALESFSKITMRTGIVGNAYADAPACIRSCIWVPFFPTPFLDTGAQLYLGQFDTDLHPFTLKGAPVTGSVTVSIPWHYTGWRRAYCEDVYLYLPLVGMVNLSSDSLAQQASITVHYSATATDGCVSYQVKAGNQIIGSYGGQCSANYPIGISQQASAGQIAQTAFAGIEKTVAAGVSAAQSINPLGIVAGGVQAGMSAVETEYQIANTALSRNNSCIGGVGGGAGAGLDLNVTCYTVTHDTIIDGSGTDHDLYVATMGAPVMKSMSLSGLQGYCQCANAHVSAPATEGELDAIDSMVNGGFFIE